MSATHTLDDSKVSNIVHKPFKTLLFNDTTHNMYEVSAQIMKAINCTPDKASQIMLEAHNMGRAVVITAHREKCELVAAILEEIRLGTKVEPA